MAALILEVVARHGSQFHPLDKPVIRIGRALDNDIILTDPAISPHHLVIRRSDWDHHFPRSARPGQSYYCLGSADAFCWFQWSLGILASADPLTSIRQIKWS